MFQNTNPYKKFGYTSNVEYKLPMDKLFRVINSDTTSEIKAMTIDFEKAIAYLLGENDALISEFAIDPKELMGWITPDPKASKYPHQSPYAYCSNNPVMKIDPNGMEDELVMKDPPQGMEPKEHLTKQNSTQLNKATTQDKSTSIGYGASIDITIAAGGVGGTAEIGFITDSKGNSSLFVSYGNAVGAEASIGVNALVVPQSNFSISNFEGRGANANISLDVFSLGVFTDQSAGAVKDSYNNSYLGFKIGAGYGVGASSVSQGKTTLINVPKRQNISNSVYYSGGHK